jgi:hypothetical protein
MILFIVNAVRTQNLRRIEMSVYLSIESLVRPDTNRKWVRRLGVDALSPIRIKCDPLTIRHQRNTAGTFHNSSIMPRIPIKVLCRQHRSKRDKALTRVLNPWTVVSTGLNRNPETSCHVWGSL